MKTLIRFATTAALLVAAGQALAYPTPEDCRSEFSRSEASLTCQVSGVQVPVSKLCHMQISCRRDDGSYKDHNGAFFPQKLANYCNRNGELVLGCAPRP